MVKQGINISQSWVRGGGEKEGESAEEGLMGENKPRKDSLNVEIIQSVGCSPHIN